MSSRLDEIRARHADLADQLADPSIHSDRKRYEQVSRAYAELEPILELHERREKVEAEIASARAALDESGGEPELAALAREEIEEQVALRDELDEKLRILTLPKDPNDEKNVILEIRAGTGGDEATLFAAELLRMYLRHAETEGWTTRVIDSSESAVGGVKEAIVVVEGRGAWSRLKYESGVHRVQRVPETESSGRIHTSAASVAVLPEVEAIEVELDEKDLRIDTYAASGAGGQHVNRTLSAVRVTHLPTGLVAQCQDQKSQHANKAAALSVLGSRLHALLQAERDAEQAADRRAHVGSGDRSEKIRTYNFPQGRVTDHRVPVTVHRLQEVLDGGLEAIAQPVADHFQAERLREHGEGS